MIEYMSHYLLYNFLQVSIDVILLLYPTENIICVSLYFCNRWVINCNRDKIISLNKYGPFIAVLRY